MQLQRLSASAAPSDVAGALAKDGAVIVESLQFYLADSGLPIPAVIGAIFVICILLFRHGIVGEYQRLRAKWR